MHHSTPTPVCAVAPESVSGQTRIVIHAILTDPDTSDARASELLGLYLPRASKDQVKAHRAGKCICKASQVDALLAPTAAGEHLDHRANRAPKLSPQWEPKLTYGEDGAPAELRSPEMPPDFDDEGALAETLAFFGVTIPDGYRARVAEVALTENSWTRQNEGEDAVTRPGRRIRWVIERIPGHAFQLPEEETVDLREEAEKAAEVARIYAYAFGADPKRTAGCLLADWQLGQCDGGGLKEQVRRISQIGTGMCAEVARLRRAGTPASNILLVGLGDLVEGCDGFYATQTFGVQADRRGQVTMARRLLNKIIAECLTTGLPIQVAGVAGNHGENRRNGKSFTGPGDNDDLAILEQVHDIWAAQDAPVTFTIPRDRLNLVMEVQGHVVGLTHGHLARSGANPVAKVENWMKSQALAREPIGDADIIIQGHYHHTIVADIKGRLFIQAPAMCDRSQHFAESYGLVSRGAGFMTFTIAEGQERVDNIRVHEEIPVAA